MDPNSNDNIDELTVLERNVQDDSVLTKMKIGKTLVTVKSIFIGDKPIQDKLCNIAINKLSKQVIL